MKECYIKKLNSYRIAIADLMLYKGDMILTRINVPFEFRRNGIGTQLLKEILDDADKEKIKLWCWPVSLQFPRKDLISWYEKYGFKFVEGELFREPKEVVPK